MMEKTLQETARELGLSNNKARSWLSLVGAKTEKKGRLLILPPDSICILSEMSRLVAEGITPTEAAKKAKHITLMLPATVTAPQAPAFDLTPVVKKMEALEEAIRYLIRENKSLHETIQSLAGDNLSLRKEIRSCQWLLTPAPARSGPEKTASQKVPLEENGLLYRFWIQFIEPLVEFCTGG